MKFDLALEPDAHDKIYSFVQTGVVYLKGTLDMTAARSRIHELAAAVKAYSQKNGKFPRGTFARAPSPERAGLPHQPSQRVSWMAELLPYLNQDDLYKKIATASSWQDPINLLATQTIIPQFLAVGTPSTAWWVEYPGMKFPVAATHFVGVSGIGPDAAEYIAGDVNVAKRLGVFGYERETRLEDIKDGLENTIVMLQVPTEYKTSWMAGGGSTVRGILETDSVRPFVCTTHNKKRGTFAIMADGRVRFIAEDIGDEKFKALCTINGGEKIDVDQVAPVVPAPTARAEMKAQLPATPKEQIQKPAAPPAVVPPAPPSVVPPAPPVPAPAAPAKP